MHHRLVSRAASIAATMWTAAGCEQPDARGEGTLAAEYLTHDAEPRPESRGLLASHSFESVPMKGVYFFPGDVGAYNSQLYTAHPTLAADQYWNSDPLTRASVVDRIIASHANTLVMSYWGDDMRDWSPMQLDDVSVPNVLEAVDGKALLVVPALESGFDAGHPDRPHYRFGDDFPYARSDQGTETLAPALLERLHDLIALFRSHMHSWAQLYDRSGRPRYAVHIVHAYSQNAPETADPASAIARAFDAIAAEIAATEGIDLGFTLDVSMGDVGSYNFTPQLAGAQLEQSVAVLGIQGFISEIYSGKIISSAPAQAPYDNNVSNLANILDWKKQWIADWIETGIPVIYDVSSGFDGRFVWRANGAGFWGDNYDYTFDDWRNALSQEKGNGAIGITFNTWNGYTEGYAAVPTLEHRTTVGDWLTDLYVADPRLCHHVEYSRGARSYLVQGAICDKWRDTGGRTGPLGPPTSDELAVDRGRVSHFASGSVFFSDVLGTHEVHGAIHDLYKYMGFQSSCLGLPISDEEAMGNVRVSHFEAGTITFTLGATEALASCR